MAKNKWYCLEISQLKGWERKLNKAKIPITTTTIFEPFYSEVVTFPHEYQSQVLDILGIQPHNLREFKITDDLRLLSAYSVKAWDNNMEDYWPLMERVLWDFARMHSLHIFVSNPSGRSTKPKTAEGCLWIRFWSAPRFKSRTLTAAFGTSLNFYQQAATEPSGQGIPILDTSHQVVAELVQDTLYILFDLPQEDNAGTLLSAILAEYEIVILPLEEQARIRGLQQTEILEQSRCAYVTACHRRHSRYLRAAKQELESTRNKQVKLAHELSELVQRERWLSTQIPLMQKVSDEANAHHQEEFDNLIKMPKIKHVEVIGDMLIVETVELVTGPVRETQKFHILGKYQIHIPIGGDLPTIRNLDRTIEQSQHPFDTGGGRLCFGNISLALTELIGNLEFSVVAQMVIEFLELSPLDTTRINHWPIVHMQPA
jgi:hypothetical protein